MSETSYLKVTESKETGLGGMNRTISGKEQVGRDAIQTMRHRDK